MENKSADQQNLNELQFVPLGEIRRIRRSVKDPVSLCQLLSQLFRINTLYMITRAGSGHIGTSFSAMEIITWLWTQEMKNPNENKKNSDIYFSSKGHDAPGLYSLLLGLEKLDFEFIHKLRRLGGLDGHPDVKTPYMITNTGPLGMGISKARGMALAKRLNKEKGSLYILTGDGELQEGQIWESLQPTANGKFGEIIVVVDNNKIQSDTWVSQTSDLGNIEAKFKSFGWAVARCDGHNLKDFSAKLKTLKQIKNKPKILIADTVKGKGISFMEGIPKEGIYKYHAGAPSKEEYQLALSELLEKLNETLKKLKIPQIETEKVAVLPKASQTAKKFVEIYGDELVKISKDEKNIQVIDCDLVKSCGILPFKKTYPERFVECGIAEQDAVSLAGGLALKGKLPIVHSLACFLSTRPNEQIYNNATELKKIIYVGSQAGLLPAGPGHSHQSVRDISALGSVPGLVLIEPAEELETRMAISWAIKENSRSTYLRLASAAVDVPYTLPKTYKLQQGRGVFIKNGEKTAIISYGPTMLKQAWLAADNLNASKINTAVINLPWLNRVDEKWLLTNLKRFKIVFTLDDHYVKMGQGQLIAAALAKSKDNPRVVNFGIEEIPACGQNDEVLKFHSLDSISLAARISKFF